MLRPARPWLEGHARRCPACLQGYVLELEHFCAVCDDQLCIFCVAWRRSEARCPACTGDAPREVGS